MKLITRDTDYAVRALVYIAKQKKKIISAKELVKILRIPKPFLRKILQRLNKAKLLKSYKGKGGGFKLLGSPQGIRLTDLIELSQGDIKLNTHMLKNSLCPHIKTCVLRRKLNEIERHVISELRKITIASLAKDI